MEPIRFSVTKTKIELKKFQETSLSGHEKETSIYILVTV